MFIVLPHLQTQALKRRDEGEEIKDHKSIKRELKGMMYVIVAKHTLERPKYIHVFICPLVGQSILFLDFCKRSEASYIPYLKKDRKTFFELIKPVLRLKTVGSVRVCRTNRVEVRERQTSG